MSPNIKHNEVQDWAHPQYLSSDELEAKRVLADIYEDFYGKFRLIGTKNEKK